MHRLSSITPNDETRQPSAKMTRRCMLGLVNLMAAPQYPDWMAASCIFTVYAGTFGRTHGNKSLYLARTAGEYYPDGLRRSPTRTVGEALRQPLLSRVCRRLGAVGGSGQHATSLRVRMIRAWIPHRFLISTDRIGSSERSRLNRTGARFAGQGSQNFGTTDTREGRIRAWACTKSSGLSFQTFSSVGKVVNNISSK